MSKIVLPYQWEPRPYQLNAWNALVRDGLKRACLVWHRRSGKDEMCLRIASVKMMERPATYWHMLPKAEQARKAIWEAVNPHTGKRRIDEAFPHEIRENTRDDMMLIKFKNGSTWQVVGSDNYNSLVGAAPAGVVFSEWALADPEAWGYIRPMLLENNGWAMFIYTPRGPNHGLTTYQNALNSPNWFCELLTAEDTDVFTKEQLEIEKEELINQYGYEQGMALFNQEYMCSFDAAIIGAIYGKEMSRAREEGRITKLSHDPYKPVGTMWDLGYTDSTAIWFFQIHGDQVHFIDYFEASNESLEFYAEVLRERMERLHYRYDRTMMFFPHDVRHHDISTGKSRERILQELGIPVRAQNGKQRIWDGIEIVRRNFHRFWFDVVNCERGIQALTLYRRKWDQKLKTYSANPEHDWTSHAADALRIGVSMLNLSKLKPSKLITDDGPIDAYRAAAKRRRKDGDILLNGPPTFWAS